MEERNEKSIVTAYNRKYNLDVLTSFAPQLTALEKYMIKKAMTSLREICVEYEVLRPVRAFRVLCLLFLNTADNQGIVWS